MGYLAVGFILIEHGAGTHEWNIRWVALIPFLKVNHYSQDFYQTHAKPKTYTVSERNGNILQPTDLHHQIIHLDPIDADFQPKSSGQDILVHPFPNMEQSSVLSGNHDGFDPEMPSSSEDLGPSRRRALRRHGSSFHLQRGTQRRIGFFNLDLPHRSSLATSDVEKSKNWSLRDICRGRTVSLADLF